MKNYIVYALIFALSLPLFQSCSKDDDGAGSGPAHDRITFALTSEAPVAEYPGTQVSYTFTVEYPAGLSQVVATLDGKEIENSKQVYEDAPVSATYEFRYTLLASQSGQTVDFVFTATGADGYEGSIDYPVYVYASQADVDIVLPDDAPTEVDIEAQPKLAFDVNISAAAGLMKIRTLKNGEAIESLTKTEGFTSSKTDVYAFEYEPTAGDVGQTVTFTFEVTDNDGNLVTADYAVNFIRAASTELDEYYGVNVGLNRCTSYGPFLDVDACQVYTVADGYEKCADIDIVLFWSGNASTIGMAVCGANTTNASTIYNATTVTAMGGVADGAGGRRAAGGGGRTGDGGPRGNDRRGAAVDDRAGGCHAAGGQVGREIGAGVEGIGAGAAEGRRDQRRILAAVLIDCGAAVCCDHRLDRRGLAVVRVAGGVDGVFQGPGLDGQARHQAHKEQDAQCFLHNDSFPFPFGTH